MVTSDGGGGEVVRSKQDAKLRGELTSDKEETGSDLFSELVPGFDWVTV